jgi:hypothetical protein
LCRRCGTSINDGESGSEEKDAVSFGQGDSSNSRHQPASFHPSSSTRQSEEALIYSVIQEDRRKEYWLGVITTFALAIVYLGMGNVDTLYYINQPFCWPSKTLGE